MYACGDPPPPGSDHPAPRPTGPGVDSNRPLWAERFRVAKQIVIGHRGWVFVGDVSTAGDEVVINNARNVRRWGTKSGLGELAEHGPLSDTMLDPAGTVRMHRLAVIASIDCNAEAWHGK